MNERKNPKKKYPKKSIILLTITLLTIQKSSSTKPSQRNLEVQLESINEFVDLMRQEIPKRYTKELNATFTKKCSSLSRQELEYSDEEIRIGDSNLADHMSWARIDNKHSVAEYFSESKDIFKILLILSKSGQILVFVIELIIFLTTLMGFFAVLFYCYPQKFQMVYSCFVKTTTTANVNFKGKSFISYPYFRDLKNWLTKKRISPFNLFGMRFISSGVVVFCLLIACFQIMRVSTKNDCGLMRASLDVTLGKKGTMFSEFGLLSNKSLLNNFKMDLEEYTHRPFEMNFQKILDKNFIQLGDDINLSMDTFYKKVSELEVLSCSRHKMKLKPMLVHNIHYRISDEISEEVTRMVQIGDNINDAAEYLKEVHKEKEKKLDKFNNSLKEISMIVDLIMEDIYYVTYKTQKYLESYDNLIGILVIIAVVWLIYALIQMFPSHVLPSLRLPKTSQMIIQFTGATLMFILGGLLFIETQTMIQGCLTANQVLDDPDSMKNFLGANQVQWIEVCLARSGTGDIEDLIPPGKRSELEHGFNVLRGLSINMTALRNEMPNYKLKEVTKFERKIDSLKNHHKNLLYNFEKHSYYTAINKLNKQIKCTGLTFALTTTQCRSKFGNHEIINKWPEGIDAKNEKEDFSSFPTNRKCVVLPSLDPPMSPKIFRKIISHSKKCESKITKGSITHHMFSKLNDCLASHEDFMTVVQDHLKVVLLRVQNLNKNLLSISKAYESLRSEFEESLGKYERRDKVKIEDMLNCKSLRKAAKMMLGSYCYASKGLRHGIHAAQRENEVNKKFGFGAWFWFFVAGFGLISISISNFLEGLVDKTLLRKYRELSGRGEDTGLGFESELGPI